MPRPHVLRWPGLNRCCPGGPVKGESWPKIAPKETNFEFQYRKISIKRMNMAVLPKKNMCQTCPTSVELVWRLRGLIHQLWRNEGCFWRRGGDKGSTTFPWTLLLLWLYLCMWKSDFEARGLSLAPARPKPGFQRFVSPVSCRAASRHHSGDSGENGFDGRLVHGKIPSMSGIYIGQNVLVSSGFQEFIQLNSII